jgi:small-conductance mechanosensitive channel/nucleotide-binding universal stress UspA family protein
VEEALKKQILRQLVISVVLISLLLAFLWAADVSSDVVNTLNLPLRQIAITVGLIVLVLLFTNLVLVVLRPLFEMVVGRRSEIDLKMGWQFISWLFWIFAISIVLATVWNLANLGLTLGIVAGALVLILQRPLTNIIGWMIILFKRPFQIGDRIEINNVKGYVVEIGILSTKVREFGAWLDGDDLTGRHIGIPNYWFIEYSLHNYTFHTRYIWDRVTVTLTYESDIELAEFFLLEATRDVIGETMKVAAPLVERDLELKKLSTALVMEPEIRLKMVPSGVDISAIYFCLASERHRVYTEILRKAWKSLSSDTRVEIAYPHMELVKWDNKHTFETKLREDIALIKGDVRELGNILLVPVKKKPATTFSSYVNLVAQARGLKVVYLHILSLEHGRASEIDAKLLKETRAEFEPLVAAAKKINVEAELRIEIKHEIMPGLMRKVDELRPQLVMMSSKHDRKHPLSFGRIIDNQMKGIKADILVVHGKPRRQPRRVLLLAGRGPNFQRAFELVCEVGPFMDFMLTIVYVATSEELIETSETMVEELAAQAQEKSLEAVGKVVFNREVLLGVKEEAEKHDLIVMGSSEQKGISVIFGTLPQKVARETEKPILIYRTRSES